LLAEIVEWVAMHYRMKAAFTGNKAGPVVWRQIEAKLVDR
jgi:hypothetical protein